jgi:large subunit ribosomal protein L28
VWADFLPGNPPNIRTSIEHFFATVDPGHSAVNNRGPSLSEDPMPYVCHFTGKKSTFGKQRTYRGQKIQKGGFGLKPTGITRRKFRPNLQKVTAVIDGVPTRILASAKAIKSGLVVKPLSRKIGYTRPMKAAGKA